MHTRIRKAREALGYTRERFAELLDVSVSYMAEVESPANKNQDEKIDLCSIYQRA